MNILSLVWLVFTTLCTLPAARAASDPWNEQRWIQKVANALEQRQDLSSTTMAQLMQLERSAIVAYFLNRDQFSDAALAALMHFYGRDVSRLKAVAPDGQTSYHPMVWALPQAMSAARNAADGLALDLFDPYPKVLIRPPTPQSGDADGFRKELLRRLKARFTEIRTAFRRPDGTWDKLAGCDLIPTIDEANSGAMGLALAGFEPRLEKLIRSRWLGVLSSEVTRSSPLAVAACDRPSTSAQEISQTLVQIERAIEDLFAQLPLLETPEPSVRTLRDLPIVTVSKELPPLLDHFTGEGFWRALPNSSSNYNRKRAAYLLRTFFCDELGAISVESGHSGEIHGGNPACQSCHFKLDPLAGLFRNHGYMGKDYTGSPYLLFDDFGEMAGDILNKYLNSWKNPDDSWRIGYYLQPGAVHPDWRGNSLSDFLDFASRSKDVKTCFIKRIAEHFLGERQAVDGAWLATLTLNFNAAPNSGIGFKHLIGEILLSRAFATEDPDFSQCYDGPKPGDNTAHRPPCAVAHLLEENCTSCHNDRVARGNLDLSQWQQREGSRFGFPHQDHGTDLSVDESFDRLQKRISGTSLGRQMPIGRMMNSADRQKLYQWFGEQKASGKRP